MYVDLHYHARQLMNITVDCNTTHSCHAACAAGIPIVIHFMVDPSFQTSPYIYIQPFLSTTELYVLDQELSKFAYVHSNDI